MDLRAVPEWFETIGNLYDVSASLPSGKCSAEHVRTLVWSVLKEVRGWPVQPVSLRLACVRNGQLS